MKFGEIIKEYEPYLDSFWQMIYRMAIVYVILFFAGFSYAGKIIQWMVGFFRLSDVTVTIVSPFQFLDLAVDIGLSVASFLIVPFAIWQIYSFIKPAVSKKEFNTLLAIIPGAFILFALGFVYGFLSLYWCLEMIAKLNVSLGLKNMWDASLFVSELTLTATLLGVLFQFPLIMVALMKSGIVNRAYLKEKRREAYAIIMIIVSLLPPTDGVSLVVMTVPLVLLYELSIFWSR